MKTLITKKKELHTLALRRRSSRWEGYKCLGDYPAWAYECDFVSPYTKSANHLDADVMVLLQDWSSDTRLKKGLDPETIDLGHTPSLPTNKTLKELLDSTFGISLEDTYATNLFPFIKLGGMSSAIARRDLARAAKEFAIPQVKIIEPKIVVCLGLATFNAMRKAYGLALAPRISIALDSPFKIGKSKIWCQAHTGARGQNNRAKGDFKLILKDWAHMKSDVPRARKRAKPQIKSNHTQKSK